MEALTRVARAACPSWGTDAEEGVAMIVARSPVAAGAGITLVISCRGRGGGAIARQQDACLRAATAERASARSADSREWHVLPFQLSAHSQ